MKAIIVGSGPSARGFIPPDGVHVFAVNGAIEWIPRADYWFTLDPSADNLRRMNNPRPGVKYCAAVPEEYGIPAHVERLMRYAWRGEEPQPAGTPVWWLWRWSAVQTLSNRRGIIHTGNSAWGALGLAYHLGCDDALLVGVDGTTDARIEGGRPNNLSHLPFLFRSALNQVRVRTVGRMDGIETITVDEWLKE